jgi:hypothetical protein
MFYKLRTQGSQTQCFTQQIYLSYPQLDLSGIMLQDGIGVTCAEHVSSCSWKYEWPMAKFAHILETVSQAPHMLGRTEINRSSLLPFLLIYWVHLRKITAMQ